MSDFVVKAPAGGVKKKSKVGRGPGSGNGKTSGKGHKGQKARSGGGVRVGFEGGQTPLFRRLPRRGFSNHPFKKVYSEVNLWALENYFNDGDEVNNDVLVAKGLVKKNSLVKVLGNGELTKKLTVNVDKLSKNAKAAIEKAGGSVTE
jgi:large subunit ribosomal protein L15